MVLQRRNNTTQHTFLFGHSNLYLYIAVVMNKFTIVIFVSTLLLACFSCGELENFGGAVEEFRLFREESIFAIDEAIVSIENGLMNGTDALKWLGRQMDESIQKILVYNVPFILDKLTGEAASVGFCAADFAANRALHYLRQMKAELLTKSLPAPPPPNICQSSINALDLNAPKELRSIMTIYGYDFVRRDSFSVYFVSNLGKSMELQNAIRFQNDYEFTINLSTYEDDTIAAWDYVSIRYHEEELFAISIVQKRVAAKLTETKYISIPKFGLTPPHISGDRDFDDNGPKVVVHARLRHNRKQAYVMIYMLAEETRSDWTRAEGWSDPLYFYTAPEGWHIQRVEGVIDFQNLVNYTDNDITNDFFYTALGQAELVGDAEGDDSGYQTSVVFNFSYLVPIIIEQD